MARHLTRDPEERYNVVDTETAVTSHLRSVSDEQREAQRRMPQLRNRAG